MQIKQIQFYSTILQTHTDFLVVLPPDIPPPLPAVMLFRARPEEWLNPHHDEHRGPRHLMTVMSDLIHKGFSRPLAFILPRTCNYKESAYIGYGNALRPDLLSEPEGLGTGAMDYFMDLELIPRALETGWIQDRLAIDGFSLGGAAAVHHALRKPERFVSLGSFDGSFLEFAFDNPQISPETPSDLRLDHFPYRYGFPPNKTQFRRQNILDRVQRPHELPPAMIHYAAAQHPTANNWRVKTFLETSGIVNHAADPEMHPASAHNWYWADEHLYRTLPFHAHHLY